MRGRLKSARQPSGLTRSKQTTIPAPVDRHMRTRLPDDLEAAAEMGRASYSTRSRVARNLLQAMMRVWLVRPERETFVDPESLRSSPTVRPFWCPG